MKRLKDLEKEILGIIEPLDVDFGIALKLIETEDEWSLNGSRLFQLASVYKVPILVRALQLVDRGILHLSDRVPVDARFKTCPSGILVFLDDGLQPTILDLLVLMIIVSDNTATDMVLDRVGGIGAVREMLSDLGFTERDFRLTRSMHEMFFDLYGDQQILKTAPERIERVRAEAPNLESAVYSGPPRENVGTPAAMNRLYELILRGVAASRSSCGKGLDILLQQTLDNMMPNQLPPSIRMAHKTGGWLGVRNDSGIIFGDAGWHLIVTILTQSKRRSAIEDITQNTVREKGLVDQAIGALTKTVVGFVTEAFAQGEWTLARTTDADSVESAHLPQREQA